MFNVLIDERNATSVENSNGMKRDTKRKLVNNIIISFWNYKRVPISMVTDSNTGKDTTFSLLLL